jgi:phosphatidylserine decarboxylase
LAVLALSRWTPCRSAASFQVHPLDRRFERGAEKSVFKFGGSAVVVFGEAGAWRPAEDLLGHTRDGIETLVRLGEPIASSSHS